MRKIVIGTVSAAHGGENLVFVRIQTMIHKHIFYVPLAMKGEHRIALHAARLIRGKELGNVAAGKTYLSHLAELWM